MSQSMLVVSAHAADFVWRAGGAVALAASRGDRVKVLCLTYGERGESASAWQAGKTLEEIKALRRGEAGHRFAARVRVDISVQNNALRWGPPVRRAPAS